MGEGKAMSSQEKLKKKEKQLSVFHLEATVIP